MKVVLGLGNEGPEYRWTRHNVGFMVADAIAARCGAELQPRAAISAVLAFAPRPTYGGERVVLAKPRTLMNRSGQPRPRSRGSTALEPRDFIVVFDDADLAFGRVRVRPEGGAGGHNGVRSLIETSGRAGVSLAVKLGVLGEGRHSRDLADYVLDGFLPDERPVVAAMVELGADAVEAVLRDGVEARPAGLQWRCVGASLVKEWRSRLTDGNVRLSRRGCAPTRCRKRIVRTVACGSAPSPPACPEAIRREEVHVIRTYETVFITLPTLTDEEERVVVDAFTTVVVRRRGRLRRQRPHGPAPARLPDQEVRGRRLHAVPLRLQSRTSPRSSTGACASPTRSSAT